MKTVTLIDGKVAIPMNIKIYMTEERMVRIVTDLLHKGTIDLSEKKSEILNHVRNHLWYQGITVYGDWYEDTQETEPINMLYKRVEPFVKEMFPELLS